MVAIRRGLILPVVLGFLTACASAPSSKVEAPPEQAPWQAPEPQQQAPAKLPAVVEKWRAEARLQEAAGEWEAAAASLAKALRVAPKEGALYLQLADLQAQLGNWRQCAELAAKGALYARHGSSIQQRQLLAQLQRLQKVCDGAAPFVSGQ